MALVAGRERNTVVSWHSNFFRYLWEVIAFESPYIDKFTSQFNVDALKKLAQHILEKKIENPLKTLPRENEVTLQKFVPGPTVFQKIIGQD